MPNLLPFIILWFATFLTGFQVCLSAGALAADPVYCDRDRLHPIFARHGMVATQEATATRIGVEVLERGGNAVDAAVAVGFMLSVVPRRISTWMADFIYQQVDQGRLIYLTATRLTDYSKFVKFGSSRILVEQLGSAAILAAGGGDTRAPELLLNHFGVLHKNA